MTERIHGHRAAMAVLSNRPDDVLRVACTSEHLDTVEHALRGHDVHIGRLKDHDLEKLAGTKQHEGICLEAKDRAWHTPPDLAERLVQKRGTAIALDRVRNSYNVGAIIRSAGFFGVDAVILGAPAPHPGLDPNATRVAEGACESIAFSRTTDLADTLSRLRRKGVQVLGTDGHAELDALTFDFRRPSVLVMGNEREGLGPRIRAQCDTVLAIRGSGRVESLNVGVAAGVLIARLTAAR